MALSSRLLTLRHSPILLKLPPYLSALCIIAGLSWLLLLPLNEYSRQTYISENAILPGQVHTYFGGSEHNVFRAYRQEVYALSGRAEDDDEIRVAGLEKMFREMGLKSARQDYSWKVAGESIEGTNVYGLLQGPRADATEAMVLIAAWRNTDDVINYSGVALALTLARYFKRWSIWSKDILILIPADSYYSTQAWVSAYHSTPDSTTSRQNITALPIKAGALQAAVAIDYPAGPWGQRFANLDILYDGVNGALPNLDLLNTAVQVASSQMGISCTLHGLSDHRDSYTDRLLTLSKGIMTQSLGHATGPHSAFMPYHVDAITLKTTGDDGWHDEMTLGRTAESLLRSVNNLLEHLHQSFFLYILLSAERFVSIGNYLPAAMVVAGSFTITALALWVKSGKREAELKPAAAGAETKQPKMAVVTKGDDVAVVPKSAMEQVQRKMLLPAVVVLGVHFCGFIPFYWLTFSSNALSYYLLAIGLTTLLLPTYLGRTVLASASIQQVEMLQSFSLLFLGAALSTLATLNFSQALIIGILCFPLSFVLPLPPLPALSTLQSRADGQDFFQSLGIAFPTLLAYLSISPPTVLFGLAKYSGRGVDMFLREMARGWVTQGVWTGVVVWGLWWPAWVIGASVLVSGTSRKT